MKSIKKIYSEAIKELSEDAVVAQAPAAGDPITLNTAPVDKDLTANDTGVGTHDILGQFDPNNGIGTDKDSYIPTKKRKNTKDKEELIPLPKKIEVLDGEGELLNDK